MISDLWGFFTDVVIPVTLIVLATVFALLLLVPFVVKFFTWYYSMFAL